MAVYLATIALEKNRWTTRQPSYAISDFCPACETTALTALNYGRITFYWRMRRSSGGWQTAVSR